MPEAAYYKYYESIVCSLMLVFVLQWKDIRWRYRRNWCCSWHFSGPVLVQTLPMLSVLLLLYFEVVGFVLIVAERLHVEPYLILVFGTFFSAMYATHEAQKLFAHHGQRFFPTIEGTIARIRAMLVGKIATLFDSPTRCDFLNACVADAAFLERPQRGGLKRLITYAKRNGGASDALMFEVINAVGIACVCNVASGREEWKPIHKI